MQNDEYDLVAMLGIRNEDFDPVAKPKHYNSHPSQISCWDISAFLSSNVANAFKYVFRCGLKNDAVQDIHKSIEYLDKEMNILCDDQRHHIYQSYKRQYLLEGLEAICEWEEQEYPRYFYAQLSKAIDLEQPFTRLNQCRFVLVEYSRELAKQKKLVAARAKLSPNPNI